MIEEVAGWLPDHSFILGCDGAYSSLAGRDLPRTHIVSRIQSNAALYKPAPPRRPDQRGRPRKKGDRLGTPAELAGQLSMAGPWPTSTSAASRLSALSGHGRSFGTPSAHSSRSCS